MTLQIIVQLLTKIIVRYKREWEDCVMRLSQDMLCGVYVFWKANAGIQTVVSNPERQGEEELQAKVYVTK